MKSTDVCLYMSNTDEDEASLIIENSLADINQEDDLKLKDDLSKKLKLLRSNYMSKQTLFLNNQESKSIINQSSKFQIDGKIQLISNSKLFILK